jgi:hypothetical protein
MADSLYGAVSTTVSSREAGGAQCIFFRRLSKREACHAIVGYRKALPTLD